MRHRDNLTGTRYGYLIATEYSHTDLGGNAYWSVLCDCGKHKIVRGSHLKTGNIKSCGCMQRIRESRGYLKDLKGLVFGRLRVLEYSGKDSNSNAMWKVVCTCGREKIVRGFSLTDGTIVSCGCYNKENARRIFTTHGLSRTKEYNALKTRKYRENKKKVDSFWTPQMEALLRRVQSACVLCGSKESLCVDHVSPLSKGNGLRPGNAVILCNRCNASKRNKDLTEIHYADCNAILRQATQFYFECIKEGLWLND